MTKEQQTIEDKEKEIEELQGFLRSRDTRIDELKIYNQTLHTKTTQLETRLDACLYAMVLFQSLIRKQADKQFRFNENTNKWDDVTAMQKEVSLAT